MDPSCVVDAPIFAHDEWLGKGSGSIPLATVGRAPAQDGGCGSRVLRVRSQDGD